MKYFVDNRGDAAAAGIRDTLQPSKRKFLVLAKTPPLLTDLKTKNPGGLQPLSINLLGVQPSKPLLEKDSARFIYEIDTDAELETDPFKLALTIKNANDFLHVFPGIVASDKSISFADYRELLVSLNNDNAINRARLAKDYNLLLIDRDQIGGVCLYKCDKEIVPNIFLAMDGDSRIKFAEPNYIGMDDDAELVNNVTDQKPVEFENYWAHQLTNIAKLNNRTFGEGITIAIIDSRIDSTHKDLSDAIVGSVEQFDFCPGFVNPYAESHGTQAASVALSRHPLSADLCLGIAPKAKLLPISVVLGKSDGLLSRIKALNLCSDIARKKSIDNKKLKSITSINKLIVNCSWQIQFAQIPMAFEEAFNSLAKCEVIITCSSGNDGKRNFPHYPSDLNNTISVAAVIEGDRIAEYSNINDKVNLCAPGGDLNIKNGRGGIITALNGGGHAYASGTSFASPYAAGMAAYLWSKLPTLKASEIKQLILTSCVSEISLVNPELHDLLKAGRVDADRIVLAVQQALIH